MGGGTLDFASPDLQLHVPGYAGATAAPDAVAL